MRGRRGNSIYPLLKWQPFLLTYFLTLGWMWFPTPNVSHPLPSPFRLLPSCSVSPVSHQLKHPVHHLSLWILRGPFLAWNKTLIHFAPFSSFPPSCVGWKFYFIMHDVCVSINHIYLLRAAILPFHPIAWGQVSVLRAKHSRRGSNLISPWEIRNCNEWKECCIYIDQYKELFCYWGCWSVEASHLLWLDP